MLSGSRRAPPSSIDSVVNVGTVPGRPPAGQPVRWWAGPLSTDGRGAGRRPRSSPSTREACTWRRGPASRQGGCWDARRLSPVNTDESELALFRAERRVREIQTKLHRWARDDPHRRFDDLFNLVADPAFLLVAWDRVRGNKGARTAGVDGATASSIAARGVEVFLDELRSQVQGPQLPPVAGARADDPQGGRQAASAGDRRGAGSGGPGILEAGVGADLRGGFPPVLLRVPPEAPDP